MGTPLPDPQKGGEPPPKFSAHVYCDQTAGWMKLVLGMVVGLSPGEFVLDLGELGVLGELVLDSAPKGAESPPQF